MQHTETLQTSLPILGLPYLFLPNINLEITLCDTVPCCPYDEIHSGKE